MSRSYRYDADDNPTADRADTRRKARKVAEAISRTAWNYMAEAESTITAVARDLRGRGHKRED